MLHLLQMAVNPALNLEKCLLDWYSISCRLREAPRKRGLKIEEMEFGGPFLS